MFADGRDQPPRGLPGRQVPDFPELRRQAFLPVRFTGVGAGFDGAVAQQDQAIPGA